MILNRVTMSSFLLLTTVILCYICNSWSLCNSHTQSKTWAKCVAVRAPTNEKNARKSNDKKYFTLCIFFLLHFQSAKRTLKEAIIEILLDCAFFFVLHFQPAERAHKWAMIKIILDSAFFSFCIFNQLKGRKKNNDKNYFRMCIFFLLSFNQLKGRVKEQ